MVLAKDVLLLTQDILEVNFFKDFIPFYFMNFIPLISSSALEELKDKSFNKAQIIFKHSPRCVISNMALSRLNKATEIADADYYMLNVLTDKPLSNIVADDFNVHHESPQILIIKNGECIYTESHNGITMADIIDLMKHS